MFLIEFPFTTACMVFMRRAFKLFALEFLFTFACLIFGRQALTLLNR
ncbi:MAG: hypothetical protein LBP59_12850 [Planctomycetaceae bacterium]|nr:hypothetical protein [Planctomycetaceae bacterium]